MEYLEEVVAEFHKFGVPELKERILELPMGLRKAIAVVGLRRAGKTYLLYQTIRRLVKGGVNLEGVFYINFEDERLDGMTARDLSKIVELYRKYNPEAKTMYLFLDEIQNVDGWERFVRRILERRDARIFITGSSSKLLSKEISTVLRGRSLSFHLLPLSFQEFLRFKGVDFREPLIEDERGLIKRYLDEYAEFGGFPEIVNYEEMLKIRVLREYLDLIIYKDLVERYGIKKIGVMKSLIGIVVKNFASRISVKRLHNILLSSGNKLSKSKIYEYFSYLEDIGFIIPVKKFSYSEMESAGSIPKIYLADNGFPTIYGLRDAGRRMENIVAIELMRRKYYFNPVLEIKYYLGRNKKEVDFVVSEGMHVKKIIQVCYDPSDPYTRKRETEALVDASKELRCKNLKVITWDYEDEDIVEGRKIHYIPLWKWLLEK
ncbi:MAG: ATP-binding protein [Thermoplasmata archaeon]|nr:MAG: ATP-binding protein [Thermoplasmata archaeon]